jgi:hypothetical protein
MVKSRAHNLHMLAHSAWPQNVEALPLTGSFTAAIGYDHAGSQSRKPAQASHISAQLTLAPAAMLACCSTLTLPTIEGRPSISCRGLKVYAKSSQQPSEETEYSCAVRRHAHVQLCDGVPHTVIIEPAA